MNANKIDYFDVLAGLEEMNKIGEYGNAGLRIEAFVRQQQAEIESLRLQLSTVLTNRNCRTYDGRLE